MNKKVAILIAVVVIGATALIMPIKRESSIPKSTPVKVATAGQRIDYFASHGWEVEEIGEKQVTIPKDFSEVYEEYAVIQDRQGLPLREYAGKNAKLYVYEVKNYSPESRKMLAELLVCEDTAIASMVYSEDGGSIKLSVS